MSASSGSLPRYIIQRCLLVIPMLWILLTLVFFLMRVAPGDPVSAALGGRLSEEELDQQRQALGLDKPMIVQYWDYLSSVAHLDFGTTFTDNQPILVGGPGERRCDPVAGPGRRSSSRCVIGIPLGLLAGRQRDTAVRRRDPDLRHHDVRRPGLLRRLARAALHRPPARAADVEGRRARDEVHRARRAPTSC